MQRVLHVCTLCVHIVSPDVDSCDMKTKIEGTKRMHYTAPKYTGKDRDS